MEKSQKDNKDVGKRIRDIRKFLKKTQSEFAKPLGIKGNSLSEIESGNRGISHAVKQLMIFHYSINEAFLKTGNGTMFVDDGRMPSSGRVTDLKRIPVLGHVPAGFPSQIQDEVAGYLSLPDTPDGCYALKVKGISMRPVIEDGDYVLFVINQEIKNGDMVIANDEWGETMVKRYREKEGAQYLVSENPEYKPIEPNQNYRIVGKVIQCLRTWKP